MFPGDHHPPTRSYTATASSLAKSKSLNRDFKSVAKGPLPPPSTTAPRPVPAGAGSGSASISAKPTAAALSTSTPTSKDKDKDDSLSPPFDFNLSLPSFRPGLSRMGRTLSEFGKEVFALEDELPSRARTPGPGPGNLANLGAAATAAAGTGPLTAPPLTRSGTAPVPGTSAGLGAGAGPASAHPLSRMHNQHRHTPVPDDVPGMGDEPVMCPFCEKPLPPALIISQMARMHADSERDKRDSVASIKVQDKEGPFSSGLRRSLESVRPLGVLPGAEVGAGRNAETSAVQPKITAESLLPVVSASEQADGEALKAVVTSEELAQWARRAGVQLESDSSSGTAGTAAGAGTGAASSSAPGTTASAIAFPLIPPPPPPAARAIPPSAPQHVIANDSDDEDGDDADADAPGAGSHAGGYAKLSAPDSPERLERPLAPLRSGKSGAEAGTEGDMEGEAKAGEGAGSNEAEGAVGVQTSGEPQDVKGQAGESEAGNELVTLPDKGVMADKGEQGSGAGADDEVRAVLREVLGKVNVLSQSHDSLSASHAALLTSLKIARSNLVMAEANAEMLEDQLKRAQSQTQPQTQPSARTSTPAAAFTTRPAAPARAPSPPGSTRVIHQPTPVRRSLESARVLPPSSATATSTTASKPRPASLIIPASSLFETGPVTAPAHGEGKGMFGGFFNNSKKLLPTAKELSATAARLGDTIAGPSRPSTPGPGATGGHGVSAVGSNAAAGPASVSMAQQGSGSGQFFDYHVPSPPPTASGDKSPSAGMHAGAAPTSPSIPPRSPRRAPSPSPRLGASAVLGTSPQAHASSSSLGPGAAHPAAAAAAAAASELAKVRAAQLLAQGRMELMARELADLKRGKREMEAELETLSQALFEEANKMVADERRRRLESEEALREVKEEREALKETVLVLGGKVSDGDGPGEGKGQGDGKGRSRAGTGPGAGTDSGPGVKRTISDRAGTPNKTPGAGAGASAGDTGAGNTPDADSEAGAEADDVLNDEDWKPRDLDKHYEALRKTIHHVADGTGPSAADAAAPLGAEALAAAVRGSGEGSGSEGTFEPVQVNPILELSPKLQTAVGKGLGLGDEVNPWAEVDFSGGGGAGGVKVAAQGEGEGEVDPLEKKVEGG